MTRIADHNSEGIDVFDDVFDALPHSLQNKVLSHLDPEVVSYERLKLTKGQSLLWWPMFIVTLAWAIPVCAAGAILLVVPPLGALVCVVGAGPLVCTIWWRLKRTSSQATDNGGSDMNET